MTLSSSQILCIVEIVLYVPIVPFTIYLARKHGRTAILGYLYLHIFSLLRIAADIVELVDQSKAGEQPSIVPIILSSIGLSPLLLGVSGFLHEIHDHVSRCSIPSARKRKIVSRWLWFVQFQIHAICATGVILLIIGGVDLAESTSSSDVQNANALREAGVIILEVLSIGVMAYCLWLRRQYRKLRDQLNTKIGELNLWTSVAVLLVEVKVIYSVVYVFDGTDSVVNPVTGSLAVKVILVVLVAYLAVVSLTIGGWRSRNMAGDTSYAFTESNGTRHMYGPVYPKSATDRYQVTHATDSD